MAGTYTNTPPAGTILPAGNNQTLSVSFAPTDSIDYTTATATATVNILQQGTTTTVVSSQPTAAPGEPVVFTATVSGGLPAPYLPTGSVQFQVNGQNVAASGVPDRWRHGQFYHVVLDRRVGQRHGHLLRRFKLHRQYGFGRKSEDPSALASMP